LVCISEYWEELGIGEASGRDHELFIRVEAFWEREKSISIIYCYNKIILDFIKAG
jgi:hypothetical protein